MEFTPEIELLVSDWFRRARESQMVHYECGSRFHRFNLLLGIPTIIFSTIVGTTVFATLSKDSSARIKMFLGLLSVSAAVLASLQTFMAFGDRATKHRLIGSRYGSVRRSLEMLKTFPPSDEQEMKRIVEEIRKELDDLAESSPDVPSRIKRKIDNELKSRDHKRIFDLPASRP